MGMMEDMMNSVMGSISKEERMGLMDKMMESFFADITAEDKQRMMEQMMPKMMMGMMGEGQGGGGMMGMMPQCLNMMLPGLPREERRDFVFNMVHTLVEHGAEGMTDEEKDAFLAEVVQVVMS